MRTSHRPQDSTGDPQISELCCGAIILCALIALLFVLLLWPASAVAQGNNASLLTTFTNPPQELATDSEFRWLR